MRLLAVQLLGIYHVSVALLLVYLEYALWPEIVKGQDGVTTWAHGFTLFGQGPFRLTDDGRLILIVLATGALGSYVHSATSFVSYVGNRRLRLSWVWWYMLRPFIGLALALVFYFVVRGGLLSTGTEPGQLSVFGVAAVSGLVGMFSKQATDKLREAFDTVFRVREGGDEARTDKLDGSVPVTEVMIARNKIVACELADGQTDADLKLADLHSRLVGLVTRIPIFTHDGAVKYVIHGSVLYRFLADKSIEAARTNSSFQASNFSLADLLAQEGVKELVADALAFVAETASVADARAAMNKVEFCQDVFVTARGRSTEPVRGWLTNGDLVRVGPE